MAGPAVHAIVGQFGFVFGVAQAAPAEPRRGNPHIMAAEIAHQDCALRHRLLFMRARQMPGKDRQLSSASENTSGVCRMHVPWKEMREDKFREG